MILTPSHSMRIFKFSRISSTTISERDHAAWTQQPRIQPETRSHISRKMSSGRRVSAGRPSWPHVQLAEPGEGRGKEVHARRLPRMPCRARIPFSTPRLGRPGLGTELRFQLEKILRNCERLTAQFILQIFVDDCQNTNNYPPSKNMLAQVFVKVVLQRPISQLDSDLEMPLCFDEILSLLPSTQPTRHV